MNKKDFIEYVAINSDIPKASAIAIVDIFTNSIGLATAAAHFTFRPNISKTYFTEVYTNSGGLSTPALTAPTAFDDNNPAYRF